MARLAPVRARLHAENPHCCYCNRLTFLRVSKRKRYKGRGQRADDATLEHKGSRWDGVESGRNRVANLTIACYECNHKRGREQEAAALKVFGFSIHMPKRGRDKGTFPANWFRSWENDLNRFDCF